MVRVKHKGEVKVEAEQVAITKSTHITGKLIIASNVLLTGEIIVEGPFVITGNVAIAKGAHVEADEIVHNGELETPED